MAKKQIKPHVHQVDSPDKMTLRVEYVGIIAVACLVVGVIIGSSFFGAKTPAPTQASSQTTPMDATAVQSSGQGDPKAMVAMINNIEDYEQLVRIGNQAYDSNNPHIAIPAYEKALSKSATDPNVITDLGVMYKSIGQYEKAVQQFRKAAAIAPTHAFSRYNLGIVLMQDIHDNKGAKAAFEEFLKLAPTDEKADKAREFITQLDSAK